MNQSTINEKQASGTVGKIRSLVLMLGNKLWFIFISKKSIVIPFHEVLTIQKIMPPYFNSLQTAAQEASVCHCRVDSMYTWSDSLALGMVGAVDRPSRGCSERRSASTPAWTRLIHPSVTAETFSCSISAGLDKYSAVTLIREWLWRQREMSAEHQAWRVTLTQTERRLSDANNECYECYYSICPSLPSSI